MPGGRPTKLTPEVQQKICQQLAIGNTITAACAFAGVSDETFGNWMKRGEEEGEGEFFGFLGAVKKAQADAHAGFVAVIRQAGMGGRVVKQRKKRTVTTTHPDDTQTVMVEEAETETELPPDARAAESWLRVHDPENWSHDSRDIRRLEREQASMRAMIANLKEMASPLGLESPPCVEPERTTEAGESGTAG